MVLAASPKQGNRHSSWHTQPSHIYYLDGYFGAPTVEVQCVDLKYSASVVLLMPVE